MKKIISFFVFGLTLAIPFTSALAAVFPSDSYYSNQWYLEKIGANIAWDKITATPDITIAVIDSGVAIKHPDLKKNIWKNTKEIPGNGIDDDHNGFIDDVSGWDFVTNTADPNPKTSIDATPTALSHGTIVSGIIGAVGDNSYGITGVTWNVKIMPLRALNEKGEGRVSDVIKAIDYAIKNKADIINLSFTGFSYSESLREALMRAYNAGVLVTAAAGNDETVTSDGYSTDKTPIYPACYQGNNGEKLVIGVAATDQIDEKAPFSSHGHQCIDLTAPGVGFFGTMARGFGFDNEKYRGYFDGYWSGTSMATPLVSGALALIKEANPNLSHDDIIKILLRSTDNIDKANPNYIGQLGVGRLNVGTAVNWAFDKLNDFTGQIIISPYYSGNNVNRFESHLNKIKLTQANGTTSMADFNVSSIKTNSDISVAGVDLAGDGNDAIAVGSPKGEAPSVSIFSRYGKLKKKFSVFTKKYLGGVSVSNIDINGDGKSEIMVAPLGGYQPLIQIYDASGKLKKEFLAYDKTFTKGISVAAGDVDGDGKVEIVAAPGIGGGPHIKVFDTNGKLESQFMAYDKNFRGGVKIAVGNVDGRVNGSRAEIITAPQSALKPQVNVFDSFGNLKKTFLAYDNKFTNGLSLAVGDLNNDGSVEIITGVSAGGAPHVRVFKGDGEMLQSFYAYPETFSSGVNVGYVSFVN
ncbi:MAG: S8 family serine peptidase [Candidatus Falkowbacteria bacterium]